MEVEAAVPYSIGLITALACLQGIRIEDGIRLIVSSYFYSKGKGEKEMMLMMVAGFEKREIAAMIEQARETGNVFQAAELGDIYMPVSYTHLPEGRYDGICTDFPFVSAGHVARATYSRVEKSNILRIKERSLLMRFVRRRKVWLYLNLTTWRQRACRKHPALQKKRATEAY